MKEATAELMVEVEQLRREKNVMIEKCAQIAETWGDAPPNPTGRRAALAAEIRRLQDSNCCADSYQHEKLLAEYAAITRTAQILRHVAEVGLHPGHYLPPEVEQAAQSILLLHRDLDTCNNALESRLGRK